MTAQTAIKPSQQLAPAPKWLPALLALVLVAALIGVAMAQLNANSSSTQPAAQVLVKVAINFLDQPDGSVTVVEASTQQLLYRAVPGEDGFLRSTVRGLARERKRSEIGAEQAFELISSRNGRLTLRDPATERHVDLEAFGPNNAGLFLKIINAHLHQTAVNTNSTSAALAAAVNSKGK